MRSSRWISPARCSPRHSRRAGATARSGSAAAWLFTIAHHVLTDSARRGRVDARARRRIGIRDAIAYSTDDLERIESQVSQSGWATQLLDSLPADQRDAVQARIIDERSFTEIAQYLQTSELVVRKRVSLGLSALRGQTEELLPEFHDQLRLAAGQQAKRRLRWRIAVPRTRFGTLVLPVASILVAVTVGVIALTAGRSGPSPAPASKPSSVTSSRTELLLTLGVLRTPQSASDRRAALRAGGFFRLQTGPIAAHLMKNPQYRETLRDRGYPRIDDPLVRTVRLASGGALTLVPMTFRETRAHIHGRDRPVTFTSHGPRIEGLALELRLPGTDLTGVPATSVAMLRTQGINVVTYDRGRNVDASVVPDRVTKVTLSAFRTPAGLHLSRFRIPTVTTPVHDNVAVLHVVAPKVTARRGRPGDEPQPGLVIGDAYTRMTWFGAKGQMLNQTTIQIPFNFIVRAHH